MTRAAEPALVVISGFGRVMFAVGSRCTMKQMINAAITSAIQVSRAAMVVEEDTGSRQAVHESVTTSARTTAAPESIANYRAAPMFSVSQGKLAVMSVCTMGIYEWYWFLKQWDGERKREREDISRCTMSWSVP